MNLDQLTKVAEAMVQPGKGILAADESSGTIKNRFDAIGVESTADSRRDYRELLFRSTDAMKNYISGVILYDETIRQQAKDGTPLVKLIEQAGAVPGIKVDSGAKPLPFSKGETVTEGLDGLRERLKDYHGLGARFAKWRAVIDIGDGKPSYAAILANAHALARYAALCQEADIVPIVEPEVLMDGGHDIETCAQVTEWVLKEVYQQLFYQNVALEGTVLKPNMVVPGKKCAKQASVEEVARAHGADPEALRTAGGAGHRLPVRRPVGRGRDGASRRHEPHRRLPLEAHLLLRPRPAGGAAEGVVGQDRERRRRPARVRAPRQDERPCLARPVEERSREEGGLMPP